MADIAVGQQVQPLVIETVDAEKMKIVAAILQDPNPIHFDVSVVQRLGYGERPINQGPVNMAWLSECAVRCAGGRDRLRRSRVRFLGNVFAGERVVVSGSVTAVDPADGVAELTLEATADGRPVLTGTVLVTI